MMRIQCGWSADWVNSELTNKKIISVIPGPFRIPKLVKLTPFIIVTEDDLENENHNKLMNEKKKNRIVFKNGIPDPLFDIITEKYFNNKKMLDPLNLNTALYNSLITNLLWKDYNLSVSQGIPDPWKNWSVLASKGKKHSSKYDLKILDKKDVHNVKVFNKKSCSLNSADNSLTKMVKTE